MSAIVDTPFRAASYWGRHFNCFWCGSPAVLTAPPLPRRTISPAEMKKTLERIADKLEGNKKMSLTWLEHKHACDIIAGDLEGVGIEEQAIESILDVLRPCVAYLVMQSAPSNIREELGGGKCLLDGARSAIDRLEEGAK